ncbi:actin-related protein 2/3 complex subunit 5 [Cladochytrium replicatum]|nr:actin-related protein 2/3 complex subunit 5 [Cladochytrium replicatum]
MAFRKTNVEFDDENAFHDDDGSALSVADLEANVNARGVDVRSLLQRGNIAAAVAKSVTDPPAGRAPSSLKDRNTQTVMEALQAAKSAEIPAIVKTLTSDQLDVLMKYIYRGMASPETYNSSILLTWHEKVLEVSGLGSVVRVLTDRNVV